MAATSILTAATAILLLASGTAGDTQVPAEWDGLVRVESKRLKFVYLQPSADFRAYTKVLIEPAEIAFQKNWQRDYNRTQKGLSGRVSDGDVREAIVRGSEVANEIFADAWSKAGYTVVNTPGPDVLRVKTGIVNIRVYAPDVMSPGRSRSFSEGAGEATLFVEARDSVTGALLGRAVDGTVVGDSIWSWRTGAGNRAEFRDQVKQWAKVSASGLAELKSLSPINP
jgi:hypothetical protein